MVMITAPNLPPTPHPRDKRNSKRFVGHSQLRLSLVNLAVKVELHATGKLQSGIPLVRQLAWLAMACDLQPLVACMVGYCRMVDRIATTPQTRQASLAKRAKSSKQLAIQEAKRQAKLKRHGGGSLKVA